MSLSGVAAGGACGVFAVDDEGIGGASVGVGEGGEGGEEDECEGFHGGGFFQVLIQRVWREHAGRGEMRCLREFERGGVQAMQRGWGE